MMQATTKPLLELLASYDQEVEAAFAETRDVSTGTEKVQLLYRLRHMITVHDAVLADVLCPLLSSLAQDREVAERLQEGCRERNELLQSFQALTIGVTPRNAYAASGAEIERILTELQASFRRHTEIETVRVTEVLESSEAGTNPDALAARMALEVRRAPTFAHRRTRQSELSKALYRYIDRVREWADARHGWRYVPASRREEQGTTPAAPSETASGERWVPREPEPVRHGLAPPPPRRHVWEEVGPRPPWLGGNRAIPSIGEVLQSYDRAVDKIVGELQAARTVGQRVESLSRLQMAISIHDSVLDGTLCPLLRSLEGGGPLADRYMEGTKRRADLLEKLTELMGSRSRTTEAYRDHADAVEESLEELLASFQRHERDETASVSEFLNALSEAPPAPSDLTTASGNRVEAWPHNDPVTIATVMALYAERASTRSRRAPLRHLESLQRSVLSRVHRAGPEAGQRPS